MKQYKQLSYEQRCHIFILKRSKLSQRKIASMIGVNQSTVSREIQRNSGGNGYIQDQAQRLRNVRQQNAPKWTKMNSQLRAIIRRKLRMKWSPEQISGWLKKETRYSISHESIYQYISYDRLCGGQLYKSLRRKGKKYYSKRNNKLRFSRIKTGFLSQRDQLRLSKKHELATGKLIRFLVRITQEPSSRLLSEKLNSHSQLK